jgi:transcriptional regulator
MYLPAHFAETRREVLHKLIRSQPLATLVTLDAGAPVADEIPFLLAKDAAGKVTLRGHVARANPLWKAHPDGAPALAVFRGPQAYVSPGWYPSKAEHGKHVPTWNYVIVQARGPLTRIDDPAALRRFLEDLTTRHEAELPKPWSIADAPADYIEQMLKAIVGIEIAVESLTGKWKTSQNRTADDRLGVVQGMRQRNEPAIDDMAQLVESTLF